MNDLPYEDTTQRYRMPRTEIPGCALVQDLIPLYLDGEVSHESHALMADHLSQCERCSGYLAGARSVRAQILHEQQTLRAATATGPSVATVQQPIRESIGGQLWRLLMAITYVGGLGFTGLGLLESSRYPDLHPAVIAGLVAVVISAGGLVIAGEHRTGIWRLLMALTWILGIFAIVNSVIDPWAARSALFLSGALLLALATWGIWPRATNHSGSATPFAPAGGASGALLIGLGALLGALLCVGVFLFGSIVFATAPFMEPRLIGAGIALAGIAGLLLLNQRMGWLPSLTTTHDLRRAFGYLLLGGGALLGALVLSVAFGSLLPVLVGLALAGGLIVVGLRLAQRGGDSRGQQP